MSRTRTLTPELARQIQNDPRYGEALSHRVPEPGWRARARCLEHDPELFFSAAAEDPGPAMAICGDCAVRGACLAAMRFDGTRRRAGKVISPRASSFTSRVRVAMSLSRPLSLRQSHSAHRTSDKRRRLQSGFSAITWRIRRISTVASRRPCTTSKSLMEHIVAETVRGVQHKMRKTEDFHVRYQ